MPTVLYRASGTAEHKHNVMSPGWDGLTGPPTIRASSSRSASAMLYQRTYTLLVQYWCWAVLCTKPLGTTN